jgi:hypothetical protein
VILCEISVPSVVKELNQTNSTDFSSLYKIRENHHHYKNLPSILVLNGIKTSP